MLLKVVLSGLMNSAVCQNVLHFQRDNGVFPTEAEGLLLNLRDFGIGGSQGLVQRQANTFRWTRLDAYNLNTPGQAPVSLLVNIPGLKVGNSFQSLAMNSFLWHFKAFAGGKRGRGRMFIAGIDPVALNGGLFTSTEIGLWTPLITNWTARYCDPSFSSGWKLVIFGKNSSEESAHSVKAIELASQPGIQRRRKIGVGV